MPDEPYGEIEVRLIPAALKQLATADRPQVIVVQGLAQWPDSLGAVRSAIEARYRTIHTEGRFSVLITRNPPDRP